MGRPASTPPCPVLAATCALVLVLGTAAMAAEPGGDDWLAEVQRRIVASEYVPSWQRETPFADQDGGWQAPNREQGFRTWFVDSGVRLTARTAGPPAWWLDWRFSAWGASVALDRLPRIDPRIEDDRVAYTVAHGMATFRNGPEGLALSIDLDRPVSTEGGVTLRFSLAGNLLPAALGADRRTEWVDSSGRRVLAMEPPGARDAAGRRFGVQVAAWHDGGERGIDWRIGDAAEVTWPLEIVGVFTAVPWRADGGQGAAGFGWCAGTAGDVNGDGWSDLVVGARNWDGGEINEGAAFVFHGSAGGPSLLHDWSAEGDQGGASFGVACGTAGDVNGDGYSDVIVGARGWDDGAVDEGAAFVFLGGAAGLGEIAAWSAQGNQAGADYGRSVSAAGDVNGDGFSDVVVGARGHDLAGGNEGRAYGYHGSAAGLAAQANWTTFGTQADAELGWSVGSAGDVNGDGYGDVVLGARFHDDGETNEGRAVVFHGSTAGLGFAPSWVAHGEQAGAWFGHVVGAAGDVDGDGYADVLVGAPLHDNVSPDEGAVFLFRGGNTGLATVPAWRADGGQPGAQLGVAAGTAGDVNGDGYADVVVGAHLHDAEGVDEGQVRLYAGSSAGLADVALWSVDGGQAGAELGWAAFTAGDVNGDGYADVAAGARHHDGGFTDEGRALVWFGSASGLSRLARWSAESGQGTAEFGVAVAGAGDVNGDGYDDVLVGARFYDAGQANEGRAYIFHGSAEGLELDDSGVAEINQPTAQFGAALGAAGDVNGDGYSDVIVGAPRWDNGEVDEGGAFIYTGSAAGLSTAPIWVIEGNQPDARLGNAAGSAGDVNGDGFADIIVGVESWDNGQGNEGGAWVIHGSGGGLLGFVSWIGEGNQAEAFYGRSVSTAGDVNGDGYSDVIVGATAFDATLTNEGAAYVYLGSASGLSSAASWFTFGGQVEARLGFTVGPAGDVNGDGHADVIVGAPLYTGELFQEGSAIVFHGGPAGLALEPSWRAEGGQEDARLGLAAWTAGDVNGDGYSDVVVGAPAHDALAEGDGRAWVYHGSAAGLQDEPAWFADGGVHDAAFGRIVGAAGDVDGDGYADVVVGAPGYSDGQTGEGAAFLFYGNDGPGKEVRPRQRRVDDSAPVDLLGGSDSLDGFRIALEARTPFGAGRVRLEWEAQPLGSPFDGLDISRADAWSETGTGGLELAVQVDGLEPETAYTWRARVGYDPVTWPFQPHGPWFTVARNSLRETDLRTMARSAGAVPDGVSVPGEPLRLALEGGMIRLTWGDSCSLNDDGFTIYVGSLGGGFNSHVPLGCDPIAGTTLDVFPSFADAYYLVVPRRGGHEGSYGTASDGAQRPPSFAACLPQAFDPLTCE